MLVNRSVFRVLKISFHRSKRNFASRSDMMTLEMSQLHSCKYRRSFRAQFFAFQVFSPETRIFSLENLSVTVRIVSNRSERDNVRMKFMTMM